MTNFSEELKKASCSVFKGEHIYPDCRVETKQRLSICSRYTECNNFISAITKLVEGNKTKKYELYKASGGGYHISCNGSYLAHFNNYEDGNRILEELK